MPDKPDELLRKPVSRQTFVGPYNSNFTVSWYITLVYSNWFVVKLRFSSVNPNSVLCIHSGRTTVSLKLESMPCFYGLLHLVDNPVVPT